MRDDQALWEATPARQPVWRDATEAEIHGEPDAVLEALADGTLAATWTTRELALNELARRGVPVAGIEKALS